MPTTNATIFPFLSKPPPPKKKRPTQPLPPPPAPTRSKFFSSIAVWATQVHPGSPAPYSPRRRTTSPSFLDLTTLGYTSVFIHLPKTPVTTPEPMAHVNPDTFPIPPSPQRSRATLKRFRSLSILRPRTRSTPPSPTKSLSSHSKTKKATAAATIAKRKKSFYSKNSSSKPKYSSFTPLPLANELALMQFLDGGSTDDNIKRLMRQQATVAKDGTLVVGDVYRDDKGGIWRDRDEELEYAHLLSGGDADEGTTQWVTFEDAVMAGPEEEDPSLALASLAGLGRRDSSPSVKSVDSDLDPANVVQPADDEDAGLVHINVPGLVHPKHKPTTTLPHPILSIPTRANRPHLRKSPHFLLDLVPFAPSSSSSSSPSSPRHPQTPSSERSSPIHSSFGSAPRLRGKARRRPAPLKLDPRDENVYPIRDGEGDVVVDQARRDFIDGSFKPAPLPFGLPVAPHPAGSSRSRSLSGKMRLMRKTSRLGFGGIFGKRE